MAVCCYESAGGGCSSVAALGRASALRIIELNDYSHSHT